MIKLLSNKTLIFHKDHQQKWRWKIKSGNNRIIDASSQGFSTRYSAKRNFELVNRVHREWLFTL